MKYTSYKNDKNSSIFQYNFSNLTDLYNYLKSNPKVNSEVFEEQSSIEGTKDYAGEPLEKAIEYLKGGYKNDFEKFAIDVADINRLGYVDFDSRKLKRGLYGGAYLSPLVASGVPDCMIKYERDSTPKYITVYFQLNYNYETTEKQIFNRGIATINLIQLLENNGYIVDLKAFQLSELESEYINIIVNLKEIDEYLNISKCYYPLVSKEFFRRIIFRVFESVPVKNYWGESYGLSAYNDVVRDFYKLKDKDILITEPMQMNITGRNIYQDTINMFKELGLDDKFDLSKIKQKIKKI